MVFIICSSGHPKLYIVMPLTRLGRSAEIYSSVHVLSQGFDAFIVALSLFTCQLNYFITVINSVLDVLVSVACSLWALRIIRPVFVCFIRSVYPSNFTLCLPVSQTFFIFSTVVIFFLSRFFHLA